jgi:hypothetical protein
MPDARSLHDLGLTAEPLTGDTPFDQIPESLGQTYPDPLPPGTYRFQFPTFQATSPIWDLVPAEKTNGYGPRLVALFDGQFALTVVQSPDGTHNGEEYRFRVSDVPRERGRDKVVVSDMSMLLKALGTGKRPNTNPEIAKALATLSGKAFTATQEWSWRCDPNRPIWVDDGAGGQAQVEGQNGCGERYYQKNVTKVEGAYPLRVTCGKCGASIKAFGNLTAFRP